MNNSMFHLAFRAAQGIFDDTATIASRPRASSTVIFSPTDVRKARTSCGRHRLAVKPRRLRRSDRFGRGDTSCPSAALPPERVHPGEIMKAFAGPFAASSRLRTRIDKPRLRAAGFEMSSSRRSVDRLVRRRPLATSPSWT